MQYNAYGYMLGQALGSLWLWGGIVLAVIIWLAFRAERALAKRRP